MSSSFIVYIFVQKCLVVFKFISNAFRENENRNISIYRFFLHEKNIEDTLETNRAHHLMLVDPKKTDDNIPITKLYIKAIISNHTLVNAIKILYSDIKSSIIIEKTYRKHLQ